ncbi:HEPN domain-containing protein [Stygiolobus sp. CP850M]|uniref:HEPN domain-containing protein n=1 Tax=Stygiolobus sp. CP850M TaxID=3133134 RepID=UPI00307D175A
MTNAYVSCADLLLEQAKRDLEASRLLYDGKYMEQSLFYLQQATEKAHKTFRCVMQYLFQSVPENIGECMESKLTESSPYYPLIYTITYYIKQLKIDDIEKFLKEKYSHDTISGFLKSLKSLIRSLSFLKIY